MLQRLTDFGAYPIACVVLKIDTPEQRHACLDSNQYRQRCHGLASAPFAPVRL